MSRHDNRCKMSTYLTPGVPTFKVGSCESLTYCNYSKLGSRRLTLRRGYDGRDDRGFEPVVGECTLVLEEVLE